MNGSPAHIFRSRGTWSVMKLTLDLVRELAAGEDIRKLKKLSAAERNITDLEDLR